MSNPLGQKNSLSFSHMGFYVRDLGRMARFYKEVMCFFETDRGDLGPVQLVFLSRDPCEHHQIVLATGRPTDLSFSVINQITSEESEGFKQIELIIGLLLRFARARPGRRARCA